MPITFRPQGPVAAQASIRDGLTWGQCSSARVEAAQRPGGRTLSMTLDQSLITASDQWPVGDDRSARFATAPT